MRSHIVLSMARERAISRRTTLQPEPPETDSMSRETERVQTLRGHLCPQKQATDSGSRPALLLLALHQQGCYHSSLCSESSSSRCGLVQLGDLVHWEIFTNQFNLVHNQWTLLECPALGLGLESRMSAAPRACLQKTPILVRETDQKNWPTIGKTDRRYREKERDCRKSMGGGWWREWLTSEK